MHSIVDIIALAKRGTGTLLSSFMQIQREICVAVSMPCLATSVHR